MTDVPGSAARPSGAGGRSALIIEDHPIYRDALEMFMHAKLGNTNVYAVSSIEEAVARGQHQNIGIILLDLGLPGVKGVEAVSILRRQYPHAAVVVVSASEDRREVDATLRAGAVAFVSKSVSRNAIVDVVQKVLNGEPLESPWIKTLDDRKIANSPEINLTARQREILGLLCEGMSNKEISLRLSVAEITVKMHVSAIFRELGVMNRTQAVLAARRFGLAEPGEPSSPVAPGE